MRLDEFLKDTDVSEFFMEYWGLKSCHIPATGLCLDMEGELFSTLISLPRLRYPQVRVLNSSGAINPLNYTLSNRHELSETISTARLAALAIAPNTIKFEDVDTLHPVLANWAEILSRLFASRVTLNAYFSFGPADGISQHYDLHHIFAIQLSGEKEWIVGTNPVVRFPHASIPLACEVETPETETKKLTLKAGEILYIPPGLWHKVRTDRQSTHITIGIHAKRCFQTLFKLIEQAALRHPELRVDMPFVVEPQGLRFISLSNNELHMALLLLEAEHIFNDIVHDV